MSVISPSLNARINTYTNVSLSSPSILNASTVDNTEIQIDKSGVLNTENKSDSFTKSVLQSLQNLGLNIANEPTSTNEAVQAFTQNLYQTLNQVANPPASTIEPLPTVENKTTPPTKISGGTNFQYTVDFSQAELGNHLADVVASMQTALEDVGQYISSKIIFNLNVVTGYMEGAALAGANASLISTTHNQEDVNVDTLFIADSIDGTESNPHIHDSTLLINLAKLDEMSFSGTPPTDKYDLTTIFKHEILHGLAFTGTLEADNTEYKSAYDGLIATKDDRPVFIGRHAKTANGGNPVPLALADAGEGSAYYHVDIPSDLMSTAIKKGEVKSISNLDIAMLEDMGISVTGVLPTPSKVQAAYNNPTANLQNLAATVSNDSEQNSALQGDFNKLVESLGGSNSSVKLQDFLQQLAANESNNNAIQNSSGSLFSVVA